MPQLSSALKAQADLQNTKAAWSAKVVELLGPTRRLRGFRDANAAAADPAATGTEFLNIGSTGAIPISSGNIVGFGTLSGTTVRKAADLSTGASVLVLEGNGHTIRYTLGLPGSGAEFILPVSPTGSPNIGFAFTRGSGMRAPVLLDSGTGPLAPSLDDTMVYGFRVIGYNDDGSSFVAGTSLFSVRDPNVVMDQPYMARELGDIRIQRTAKGGGVVLGSGGDAFRFGGTLYLANPVVNGEANKPLQQVRIRCRPEGRWNNHPFRGTFVLYDPAHPEIQSDTTIPPAHKIELFNKAGQTIDVIEMYSTRDGKNTPGSGKPVNSKTQNQVYGSTAPVQPWWTCSMQHFWESHKPKFHSLSAHFLPPVEEDVLDHSNVREYASDPQQWPLITGKDIWNGLGSYKVCPKWSRAQGSGLDTTIIDQFYVNPARDGYVCQAIGYGAEPGATGKHTIYTPPGGSRHDRAPWPEIATRWASDRNGVRPHGAVPYSELLYHWILNYCNQSDHYFTDAEIGLGIPKSKVLNGEICNSDDYYVGSTEYYRPDINNNAVRMLSAINQQVSGYRDKYGRHYYNEATRDAQHTQRNAALGAYTYASPAAVMDARHSFTSHVLCAFDMTQSFNREHFLTRQHAWHFKHLVEMWMIGNNHPDHFTSLEIEDMARRHLEQVYETTWKPYSTQSDAFGWCLYHLGMGVHEWDHGDGTAHMDLLTDAKQFYFAQPLILAKQNGFFDRMHSLSPKCAAVLDMIIDCTGKYAVGGFLDTNGRIDKGRGKAEHNVGYDYPLDKYNYSTTQKNYPENLGVIYQPWGQTDWLHTQDGALVGDAPDWNTMHFRAQMLMALKHYYSEYVIARLDDAIAMMRSFYATAASNKIDGKTIFTYRFSMMGLHKKADIIGPIN